MRQYFVKLWECNDAVDKVMRHPHTFTLLALIARRAWKGRASTDINEYGLKKGQAMIGDIRTIGLSEKQYVTAKKRLEKWGICSFTGTSRGTIATLSDSTVFEIYDYERGEPMGVQEDEQGTSKGTSKGGNEGATNQDKRDIHQEEYAKFPGFLRFWNIQIHKDRKFPAFQAWVRLGCEELADAICSAYTRRTLSEEWQESGGQYAKRPLDFIENRGWHDEPSPAAGGNTEKLTGWKGFEHGD